MKKILDFFFKPKDSKTKERFAFLNAHLFSCRTYLDVQKVMNMADMLLKPEDYNSKYWSQFIIDVAISEAIANKDHALEQKLRIK